MISYQKALEITQSKVKSFGTEEVHLDDALDRILAEDIFAPRDFPPFNRAAMDGIAIHIQDLEKGILSYHIIETIYAGDESFKKLASGECYKIMTGAAVPESANIVIRNEDILFENGTAKLNINSYKVHQNIAEKGQDLKKGELVLKQAEQINTARIGLLAALGKHILKVQKLPQVAVLTTGNEVVPVHQTASATQINNSNLHLLKALFKKLNIHPIKAAHLLDDKKAIKTALEDALKADIIILNGGVSAGDADFIPEILEELGIQKLFHKVAIRPGKPIWCGYLYNKMVFALPGNPFSCLVTFKIFVEPFIFSCLGIPNADEQLPISFTRKGKTALDEFFPVLNNQKELQYLPINGSGDIRLGLQANAIAWHPAEITDLEKGKLVFFKSIP
ncbi:molybdopterin molybdotransferase MoeA [Pedobacter glucosidilyticus]|uniref:molybdopterin molybdotransferase MoeA n=1 Tax=Pedobacter glucosidilyticus TaxID=1122941 RepID=UPI000417BAC6|nr:molybdopterin molybdotransferase MoeA [Pedobacter glucosidilyticus]